MLPFNEISVEYNLTLGYYYPMTDVSKAASVMGRKSAAVRAKKWGKKEFARRMREWGNLGGRPKGSGKKKRQGGET